MSKIDQTISNKILYFGKRFHNIITELITEDYFPVRAEKLRIEMICFCKALLELDLSAEDLDAVAVHNALNSLASNDYVTTMKDFSKDNTDKKYHDTIMIALSDKAQEKMEFAIEQLGTLYEQLTEHDWDESLHHYILASTED